MEVIADEIKKGEGQAEVCFFYGCIGAEGSLEGGFDIRGGAGIGVGAGVDISPYFGGLYEDNSVERSMWAGLGPVTIECSKDEDGNWTVRPFIGYGTKISFGFIKWY